MGLIKTPDGGFYMDDTQVDINYSKNTVSLKNGGGGGGTGNYLTLDGGTMNADAVITATDELQIQAIAGDNTSVIGITPEGVSIINADDSVEASVRAISNTVEIKANATTFTFNSTGLNAGNSAISNIHSLAGATGTEIAVESDLDMNSHKISGLPTSTVADATGADDVVTQLNALLATLRTAGIIPTA